MENPPTSSTSLQRKTATKKTIPYQENAAAESFRGLTLTSSASTARREVSWQRRQSAGKGIEEAKEAKEIRAEDKSIRVVSPPVSVEDDDDGSDTEEEMDIVVLLEQKAVKEADNKRYDVQEKTLLKQYQRLEKLATRKPKYKTAAVACLFSVLSCQSEQKKWAEAKSTLALIAPYDLTEAQTLSLEMHSAFAMLKLDDIDGAMAACSKMMKARRKKYGKTDPRYYDALSLKISILFLHGETEEADAYLAALPLEYHGKLGLLNDGQTLPTDEEKPLVVERVKEIQTTPKPNLTRSRFSQSADAKDVPEGVQSRFKGSTNSWDPLQLDMDIFAAAKTGSVDDMRLCNPIGIRTAKDNKTGKTPLHVAANEGHLDMVRFLVLEAGLDLNAQTRDGCTPLFFACVKGGAPVAGFLLENGANVNELNKAGDSALIVAVRQSTKLDVVALLLDKGVKVWTKNYKGETAYHAAAQSNCCHTAELLLHHADEKTNILWILKNERDLNGLKPINYAETDAMKKVFTKERPLSSV